MTTRARLLLCVVTFAATACAAEASSLQPQSISSVVETPASDGLTSETATLPQQPVDVGALPDLAVVSNDGFVAVVRDGSISDPVRGIIAADRSTLIEATSSGQTTSVAWIDLTSGRESARYDLAGVLTPVATDMTGNVLALTAESADSSGGTEIVIATMASGEAFRHSYESELLPEGFSNAFIEGSPLPLAMFVVEYLDPKSADATQAEAPRRYRVRVLDTTTAELQLPLNLRDKSQSVDEDMLGFSRTHVTSRKDGLLFTLYRGLEEDATQYAFVHTLGFVNGVWCLDLPPELWLERLPGAVTLVDNESTLVVASANGYVTEFLIADILDPNHLPVPTRTEPAWSSAPNADAPSLASHGDTLLVGQDSTLRWLDVATLAMRQNVSWDMQIDAVALLADGDAVAAGSGRISQITPDGELAAELPLPAGFGAAASVVLFED